jgi:hypothetical protein
MISRADGWKIALSLPGTEEVLWFKKPAVFIHGQFLTKVHDKEDAMTLRVSSMEMRDMMLEAEPKLFYITDHYKPWPMLLARLKTLDKTVLRELVLARIGEIEAKTKKKKRAPKAPAKKKTARKRPTR